MPACAHRASVFFFFKYEHRWLIRRPLHTFETRFRLARPTRLVSRTQTFSTSISVWPLQEPHPLGHRRRRPCCCVAGNGARSTLSAGSTRSRPLEERTVLVEKAGYWACAFGEPRAAHDARPRPRPRLRFRGREQRWGHQRSSHSLPFPGAFSERREGEAHTHTHDYDNPLFLFFSFSPPFSTFGSVGAMSSSSSTLRSSLRARAF